MTSLKRIMHEEWELRAVDCNVDAFNVNGCSWIVSVLMGRCDDRFSASIRVA